MTDKPTHPYYLDGAMAKNSSILLDIQFYNDLEAIPLNRVVRRELLEAYLNYLSLHISDFGEMRSFPILKEILS